MTLRTVTHQSPLSMGFSRQGHRSELPFPTPGDLPDSGIELTFLASPVLAGGIPKVVLVVKNLPATAGDTRDVGLIPESGRSPGVGNGNSLQYSCLENSMDRGGI